MALLFNSLRLRKKSLIRCRDRLPLLKRRIVIGYAGVVGEEEEEAMIAAPDRQRAAEAAGIVEKPQMVASAASSASR